MQVVKRSNFEKSEASRSGQKKKPRKSSVSNASRSRRGSVQVRVEPEPSVDSDVPGETRWSYGVKRFVFYAAGAHSKGAKLKEAREHEKSAKKFEDAQKKLEELEVSRQQRKAKEMEAKRLRDAEIQTRQSKPEAARQRKPEATRRSITSSRSNSPRYSSILSKYA